LAGGCENSSCRTASNQHFADGFGARGAKSRDEWEASSPSTRRASPSSAVQWQQMQRRDLPEAGTRTFRSSRPIRKGIASRDSSGQVSTRSPRPAVAVGGRGRSRNRSTKNAAHLPGRRATRKPYYTGRGPHFPFSASASMRWGSNLQRARFVESCAVRLGIFMIFFRLYEGRRSA